LCKKSEEKSNLFDSHRVIIVKFCFSPSSYEHLMQ
jgi:hypothetical protein